MVAIGAMVTSIAALAWYQNRTPVSLGPAGSDLVLIRNLNV